MKTNVERQLEIIRIALQYLLSVLAPGSDCVLRVKQITTLRRLIYIQSDIILVARTGFGKSLIFYAYLVLTGLMTI